MKREMMKGNLLPLKGAVNFRDMGGLGTADGRKVRKGLLFRSAELTGLTEEDMSLLQQFQIKRVFDYRRWDEAERKPDPLIGIAVNERVSVMKEENLTTQMFVRVEGFNKEYYRQFTVEKFIKIYTDMPVQNASYKRLMTLLKHAEEHLPLVHHCTVGRDRTGVGSMIILMTLGVPYQTVVEDYLWSNEALAGYHHKLFEKASQHFSEEELIQFKDAFLLREDYLQAAMNKIVHTYRDFDTYLSHEFGITEPIRERIKDFCLE